MPSTLLAGGEAGGRGGAEDGRQGGDGPGGGQPVAELKQEV